MVLADSHGIPRAPRYSGFPSARFPFRLQGYYLLWLGFPSHSAKVRSRSTGPTTPLSGCPFRGLGSSPFARRYLGNRSYFLFLQLLRCFSSLGCLPDPMCSDQDDRVLLRPGFPIRISADRGLLAAPRSFSQLTASFFVSWRLGIRRMPFLT